jgi:hypothetical protein
VYPIVDLGSTVAGLTWVLHANQQIADSGPMTVDGYTTPGRGGDNSTYEAERLGGYAIMGLFGASAIYGAYVEVECAALREDVRSRGTAHAVEPGPKPKRAGFPGSVYGFGFAIQQQQAAQLCAAKGQEWHIEGATGLCQSKIESVANPDLRLEFRMGVSSEITVVYRSLPAELNKNYGELYASLRGTYGPPQVEPAHISADCAHSLAHCLEMTSTPRAPSGTGRAAASSCLPFGRKTTPSSNCAIRAKSLRLNEPSLPRSAKPARNPRNQVLARTARRYHL